MSYEKFVGKFSVKTSKNEKVLEVYSENEDLFIQLSNDIEKIISKNKDLSLSHSRHDEQIFQARENGQQYTFSGFYEDKFHQLSIVTTTNVKELYYRNSRLGKVLNIASNMLKSSKAETVKEPELIIQSPWSLVFKYYTDKGTLYLKQASPDLYIEADINLKLKALSTQSKKYLSVPEMFDEQRNEYCFFTKECGDISLRTLFSGKLDVPLLCKGVGLYLEIQQVAIQSTSEFIKLGVPDLRTTALPSFLKKLLDDTSFLESHGATALQVEQSKKVLAPFLEVCQSISNFKIPETIDHCDFHDNNIMISKKDESMTIIDWGESVIAHPFFSLISCINNTTYRYKLTEDSVEIKTLKDAALNPWLDYESEENLIQLFTLVRKIHPLYMIYTFIRLEKNSVSNLDEYSGFRHQQWLPKYLEQLIKNLCPN